MATGLEVGGVEYISILRPRPKELIPNSGQARAEVLAVLQSIGVTIKRQPLDSGPHNPASGAVMYRQLSQSGLR